MTWRWNVDEGLGWDYVGSRSYSENMWGRKIGKLVGQRIVGEMPLLLYGRMFNLYWDGVRSALYCLRAIITMHETTALFFRQSSRLLPMILRFR